jgi:hypothetical protein
MIAQMLTAIHEERNDNRLYYIIRHNRIVNGKRVPQAPRGTPPLLEEMSQ